MGKENRILLRMDLIFLFCVLFLLLFNSYSLAQEEIKITTYYPSPFGIYAELNVADRMAIGDADADGSKDAGDLPIDTSGNPTDGLAVGGNLVIGSNVVDTDYELNIAAAAASPNAGLVIFRGGTEVGYLSEESVTAAGFSPSDGLVLEADNGRGLIVTSTSPNQIMLEPSGDIRFNGNIGVNREPSAAYDLHVDGTIRAEGNDLAEYVYVEPDVEIGDIVVISEEGNRNFKKSDKPYSVKVAGIISSDPGLAIGGADEQGQLPLGLVGQVPCKVTNENGPIKKGDLLVSSSKPGFAMKAEFISLEGIDNFPELTKALEDNTKRRQAVIGKALESLEGKEGKINVLLTN